MFDDPFVFFALVIAIVALIFARKAMNQVAELRQRLEAIQAAPAAAAAPVPPPLTPFEAFEQTLPPASTGHRPDTAAHRSRRRIHRAGRCPPRLRSKPQAARRRHHRHRLPQPDRGFEETIGTRWVVWIGGLTLALGGFFMVRYSIEAGLLGPGRAHDAGRPVRAGAAAGRRMDAPQGKHLRHRSDCRSPISRPF